MNTLLEDILKQAGLEETIDRDDLYPAPKSNNFLLDDERITVPEHLTVSSQGYFRGGTFQTSGLEAIGPKTTLETTLVFPTTQKKAIVEALSRKISQELGKPPAEALSAAGINDNRIHYVKF